MKLQIKLAEQSEAEITFFHIRRDGHQSTTAIVTLFNGPEFMKLFGTASCHPNDAYCKFIGRRVALTKALSSLPREMRREIWEGLKEKGVRFF